MDGAFAASLVRLAQMNVLEAMRGRSSIRAFLDKPVPRETIEAILECARFAPSGVNSQPWQVVVLTGNAKQRLSEALANARASGVQESPDYAYYPKDWFEPYKSRRKSCGLALYSAVGIGIADTEKRMRQWLRNYHFFGAPAGLLFFTDRRLATGSFMDTAMFVQNVMLAARGYGLATCPQASLAEYPDIVRSLLGMSPERALVCGMSLGYADASAPVNRYRLEREPVSAFTTWLE
jgi:nitroreductase